MAERAARVLLALLAVVLAAAPRAHVCAAANDTAALLELKAAVVGSPTSDSLSNWTAHSNPCSMDEPWAGVTCMAGRVSEVNLSGYALSGSVPASLDLPELEVLDLSNNQLDGSLPATLALPRLQRLDLSSNQLIGSLPASWAANFPQLGEAALQGNKLAGTLPPAWVADGAFAAPFRALLQPSNELLCGAVAPAPNHTLWYSDVDGGGGEHEVSTTLGSCAQNGNCGVATVNQSAPNLFDLGWSNKAATLDLEWLNPGVQANGAPKLGSPVTLPCYPSNAPSFFGADAALGKATWQSTTDGARVSSLPVSGNRRPATADECSGTADAPAYWVVDLQRNTRVEAVLIRAGPVQLSGVTIRVSETPDVTSGVLCKSNVTFDPNMGKIIVCERPNLGRYVSISSQSKLSLCVVEVYPLAANAALGKPTTASAGDADSTSAAQVVNGNMANTMCAQVVSGTNLAAWITIDLGYEAEVETVVVQNGFSDFKNDLEVRLGNTPVVNGDENEPCASSQTLEPRVTLPIQCVRGGGVSATGRFLTLYRMRDQASDMYVCQVLVFLASGPSRFLLAPPSPPLPPATPPPSPSPPSPANYDVIDASVDDATTAMSVVFDVEGSALLPLTPETQGNIILAAASTWAGAEGLGNVTGIQFTTTEPVGGGPAIVTAQLRVDVAAGLARDVAQFIVGTSDDGSLVQELQGQGGQLESVKSTVMTQIEALQGASPAPAPPPSPDDNGGGGGASTSGGSSAPIGAIVGGVAGGLAVVAGLAALLLVRRQRRRGGPLPSPHGSGSESPKTLGAMEQGHSSPSLMDFPKPGDLGNGYSVAALAAAAGSGNFMDQLKLCGEQLTQGPPPDVISFLANDDAASDHSAMVMHGGLASAISGLTRDSPSGWGGSSTCGGSAGGGGGGGVARTASEVGVAGAASGGAASAAPSTSAAAALQKQRSSVTTASRIDSGVSELWTVDFRELAIQKQIGEGSFGKVFLAKWRETTVAVKVLGSCGTTNTSPGLDDEFPEAEGQNARSHPLYQSLQKEAAMMASLRHPSIVMYLGVCLDPPAVVTEYCARGSLNDVLKRARSSPLLAAQLDWARRLNMALDAAKGMLYLHSCSPPIIHRDLKSANLLVDKHWRVRVCDFNLSRVMEDSAVLSSVAATNPRWLAPEILSGKGYTKVSDVYSFGICMWELLTWQVPWGEYGPWQVVAMVTESSARPEVPPPEELPTGSFGGEGDYLQLMQECWSQDPAARPTFELIISRLRRMLAVEASVRRESPTKAPALRPQSSVFSVGSVGAGPSFAASGGLTLDLASGGGHGDETPRAHSHVASLATASELGASPDPLRGPASLMAEAELLPASPSALAGGGGLGAAVSGPAVPLGPLRTLSSITSGDGEELETARTVAAAADAASIAARGSRQPAG
ncbi:hypothetical protein ABPG75_007899 [Micractinium tetrahymenae]